MRNVIGLSFIVFGILLIGIGSYNGFEKYGELLANSNKNSYYDGMYIASGDTIKVSSEEKEVIKVLINTETYDFKYNGNYYENEETGLYIIFDKEKLILYKDGEEIRTLYKEK